ncbi:MAG: restriction endonuclease subunit S [Ktedonobacteraceae bacterium]|nr:restriction endonuclease subunit S [Ktedonobacteraceae bacterium]
MGRKIASRRSSLQLLEDVPYIPLQEYDRAKRAQVKVGDILVTTTGQYLGRACTIEELPVPAVASNNVTILRPLPGIDLDHFFLAAVTSSDLGKQQIAQKQITSAGRPFIRRDDLGTISIPLPDKKKQKAIATRLREMISTVQKLTQLAKQIEAATEELVMAELFAGDNDA